MTWQLTIAALMSFGAHAAAPVSVRGWPIPLGSVGGAINIQSVETETRHTPTGNAPDVLRFDSDDGTIVDARDKTTRMPSLWEDIVSMRLSSESRPAGSHDSKHQPEMEGQGVAYQLDVPAPFATMQASPQDESASAVSVGGYCQESWERVGDRCFKVVASPLNKAIDWAQAMGECAALGAPLATLHTTEEDLAVKGLMQRVGEDAHCWIGLRKYRESGPSTGGWVWVDREVSLQNDTFVDWGKELRFIWRMLPPDEKCGFASADGWGATHCWGAFSRLPCYVCASLDAAAAASSYALAFKKTGWWRAPVTDAKLEVANVGSSRAIQSANEFWSGRLPHPLPSASQSTAKPPTTAWTSIMDAPVIDVVNVVKESFIDTPAINDVEDPIANTPIANTPIINTPVINTPVIAPTTSTLPTSPPSSLPKFPSSPFPPPSIPSPSISPSSISSPATTAAPRSTTRLETVSSSVTTSAFFESAVVGIPLFTSTRTPAPPSPLVRAAPDTHEAPTSTTVPKTSPSLLRMSTTDPLEVDLDIAKSNAKPNGRSSASTSNFGLELGLGVGIPLGLLLLLSTTCCIVSRRRKRLANRVLLSCHSVNPSEFSAESSMARTIPSSIGTPLTADNIAVESQAGGRQTAGEMQRAQGNIG